MASRASAVTQQWVDQQVDAAKNDNEPGLYSRTQAARQPRALYLRWKRLNSVMGAETSDTWMAAIGWGLAVAVPVLVLLAWAAWGRVGWQGALAFGILLGAVAGGLTAYAKWIRMVYQETYIEDITAEYHSVLSETSEITDVVVCLLQRLPFYHRPELLEGNAGQTGFKDKKAVVRTKTRFAESVLDMRDSTDYHDLPGDASDLIATPGINRFAGIKLVRECGALFKLFAVPPPKPHWSEQMRSVWPWAITGGFILGAILMATS